MPGAVPEAVRSFTCHEYAAHRRAVRRVCAQVLPPGTQPLVSLARTILGGQLDERLLGTGLAEGEGEG